MTNTTFVVLLFIIVAELCSVVLLNYVCSVVLLEIFRRLKATDTCLEGRWFASTALCYVEPSAICFGTLLST